MKKQRSTQRGQALILIALAVVGLVGFTALAIDGGNVFSDRRHSQNASDTAALAAALALARQEANWKSFGADRAISNGYDPADGVSEVDVYLCSELPLTVNGYTLTCKGLPSGADPTRYVYVHIKSVVRMLFAPIVGWREVINHTDAVARATVPEVVPWFDGNALVSVMQGCKNENGWNRDPFTIQGNVTNVVKGSGVFVNSNCSNAFTINGASSSTLVTDGPVCVVGGASYNASTIDPDPTTGCGSPIDPNLYQLPNPVCSRNGTIAQNSKGEYVATPGNYSSSFPNVSPAGTLKLQKGIYCFNNGISVAGGWTITTDLDDGNDHDSTSEGVFFFVPNGNVTFNGNATINIHAVNTTQDDFPQSFVNYLFYIPPTNQCTATFTGNGGSEFTGTILAPGCHVRLLGNAGGVGLDSQVIGYTLELGGDGNLDLTYNDSNTAVTTTNPGLEQTE